MLRCLELMWYKKEWLIFFKKCQSSILSARYSNLLLHFFFSLPIQLNSRFASLGKTMFIRKFQMPECLQNLASIYMKDDTSREKIGKAGAEIFLKS